MRQVRDCSSRLLLFLSLSAVAPAALADVDYAVGPGDLLLGSSESAADGQMISVTRTIHNLQGAAPPCPYSYFLNPPNVVVEGNGVPVEILSSGQSSGPTYLGTTPPLGPYGQADADNTATDQIAIPDGISPGTYNLVLVLDPGFLDADPSNNDTSVALRLTSNPLQITSPSQLLIAIVGVPYHYALTDQGAGSQSTWSLLAGAPPSGIFFDSQGGLSGTPTETGLFDIVVEVASGEDTQTAVLELPVAPSSAPLSIELSGPQLPSAIVNSPYVQQLIAEGGVPPYSWKGMIPQELGLTFTSEGVLSGKPDEASNGPVQFTVTVTDSIGSQASATLTIEVISPSSLFITTPFLEPGVVGVPYDQPLLASDGTITGATLNWSLAAGTTLPAGLTFQQIGNPAVGDLSGQPTQAGIFPLVVYVSDNFGHSTKRQYILTVTEAAVPVPRSGPPEAVIGEPFYATLDATSTSMPSWSLFSGTLPPGLSLSATGVISGTVPVGTAPGVYPFAAAVKDSEGAESVQALEIQVVEPPAQLQGHTQSGGCATGNGPTGAGLLWLAMVWLKSRMRRLRQRSRGRQVARGLALAAVGALLLSAPPALALLTIETVNLPAGSTGQLYDFSIGAVGGVPPYQWALVTPGGTPPPGISLVSNGTLAGEPEYDGTSSFQVSVTDSTGTIATSPVYSLTIFASGELAVASTLLEPASLGQTYSDTFHSAGGTPPYTWSLVNVVREPEYPGDLGSELGASLMLLGLDFYPALGRIEGVPTEAGVFALTVQVTDNEQPPASAQGLVLLTVSSTNGIWFETEQLPPATLNEFYSTFIETNAAPNDTLTCQVPETVTDTAKAPPAPGLDLYSNCQIQGTPSEAGIYSFLVEATDAQGGVAVQSFAIDVNAPAAVKPGGGGCQSAPGGPSLAGLLLLAMVWLRPRTRRLRQRRRVRQVARGLALAAVGALLLSAPPALALLTIETVNLPAGSTGQLYDFTIGAVGGVPPYQWALVTAAGTPPPGISFGSNGTLSGEPEYDGISSFQVTVTDSTGTTITSPVYSLTIFTSGALAVASTQLKPAVLGETYSDTLHSAGGTPPYNWSLVNVTREPASLGDEGSELGASLMSIGLGFYPALGELEGVPTEVGVFALTVEVTDNEAPPAFAQGLVLLTVSSTAIFSFETVQLPPANLDEFYLTTIETNAPANDSAVCYVIGQGQEKTPMPPGLTLNSNCKIEGVPLEAGIYSFLVEASDTEGGEAVQSFAIDVNAPAAVKPDAGGGAGGCQSSPGAPTLAGLLLLALSSRVGRQTLSKRSDANQDHHRRRQRCR